MKKINLFITIALFSAASYADDYIRKPISIMEAAIVVGGEELVGKYENCFVTTFVNTN